MLVFASGIGDINKIRNLVETDRPESLGQLVTLTRNSNEVSRGI